MASMAAGPFAVGDFVRVPALGSEGEVVAVGETHSIRAFGVDVADRAGEVRQVTMYDVRLANGVTRTLADRDGHLVRA